MTADEWERIKSIFDIALQRAASERAAWLDGACAGRPDVRATVEQLLKNFEAANSFLKDEPFLRPPSFVVSQLVASRFRVLRLIAAGGMGEVYEVFDERLMVRVALKTIRTDLLASREIYERFKREVWITRDVSHEGICGVFELIEHHDPEKPEGSVTPCLTMKLLDGHDLHAKLRSMRPLPLDEALDLIRQVCSALQALHDNNIIHRDLKPSNIMLLPRVGKGERVVLTDFGLARRLDQTTIHVTSAGNDQPGAPFYQAPEVLKGGKDSIASDIYALGLVIDDMVTTSRAFTAESIHALYWQKLREKPVPPSQRAQNLPLRWEKVILKCLHADPTQRYANPMDVVRDLEPATQVIAESNFVRNAQEAWFENWLRHMGSRRRAALACCVGVPLLVGVTIVPGLGAKTKPATIAVLPLVNEISNTDYEHVRKGIYSEMVRRLRGVQQLHVYETPASVASGTPEPIQFNLSSRLKTDAGKLRLTLELDSTAGRKSVWTRDFESSPSDSLGLESRAADALVQTVQELTGPKIAGIPVAKHRDNPVVAWSLRFFGGTAFDLPAAATSSAAAFQVYMRGRLLLEEKTARGALNAITCFEEAVRLDPRFALAWAGIADAQQVLMEHDSGSREDILRRARDAAERAVALGPTLPETYTALGAVMQVSWEWDRARQAYQKAVELDARFARAQRWYAGLLLQLGNIDEALERSRLALALDPWDYPSHAAFGGYLFVAGKPHEAVAYLERTLAEKDFISTRINLGVVCAYLAGASSGAKREQYLALALQQGDKVTEQETRGAAPAAGYSLKWSDFIRALAYAYAEKPDLARPWLDRLEQGRRDGRTSAVTVSSVYAALKDHDRSLDLLEMAAAYHDRELTNLRVIPYFEPLRGHPRFQALLKRIGLTS
ncbi:MAG TPA: protein kinase [Bryobacteraceae bacterium]|nr:protein kinase [Bryobacteraceae bacterium]